MYIYEMMKNYLNRGQRIKELEAALEIAEQRRNLYAMSLKEIHDNHFEEADYGGGKLGWITRKGTFHITPETTYYLWNGMMKVLKEEDV